MIAWHVNDPAGNRFLEVSLFISKVIACKITVIWNKGDLHVFRGWKS